MKLFVDSANVNEIKEIVDLGLCDGVTTNPTLVAKEGKDFMKTIEGVVKLVSGPVHVEPIAVDAPGIIREALEFGKLGKNVVAKLAMTKESIRASRTLKEKGMKVSFTLVFSANQAIVAAKAGADFVIPFVGRLDDGGQKGTEVVADIVKIYKNFGLKTEVLAASIRGAQHILECALAGAHSVTIPKSVIETMIKHPYTDLGVKKFIEDWKKVNG